MKRLSDRSFQWVFYLVAGFYFGATFLRSILTFRDSPELPKVLVMLFLWLIFFVSEPAMSNKWMKYFPLYLILQTGLTFALLAAPGYYDFFASLFAILSMQIMLSLSLRIWVIWIGLCAAVMTLLLRETYGNQIYALALLYSAGNVFFGFYARATRRAQTARAENLTLAQELQQANRRLQEYSEQVEQLVVARERNRLARDLHDSVTQTVFSMNLTTQSASLLLERDPSKVEAQLDRLNQLTRNALSEMQLLISELKPEEGGLAATLRSYLKGGHFPENFSVDLEVGGDQSLELSEEQSLFRIVQEALNNVVKHSQSSTAHVRLHLADPMWIEIEDHGQGFDLQRAQSSGRVGLHSMRERAVEVGWDLQIKTSPGMGTCIRVEKSPVEVRQV